MSVTAELKAYSQRFNELLPDYFPLPEGAEKRVIEAMRYSVMNGGKRLRPFLVYQTAKLFGVSFTQSIHTAVALECLHSYSLIHDDLPAMDNDDLRRGLPTCHKAFDEATAILAGDGLLTFAFELLASRAHEKAEICNRLVLELAKASGAFGGMVSGQMLDLITEQTQTDMDSKNLIEHIEEMKTGRLISYACTAGAILGQANEKEFAALHDYSRGIGIAFQITDDILDVTGSQELVGKKLRKDSAQGKATFVSLYGLDKARRIAEELIIKAQDSLKVFSSDTSTLRQLAQFILDRDH